jgi:hypothetical protein
MGVLGINEMHCTKAQKSYQYLPAGMAGSLTVLGVKPGFGYCLMNYCFEKHEKIFGKYAKETREKSI